MRRATKKVEKFKKQSLRITVRSGLRSQDGRGLGTLRMAKVICFRDMPFNLSITGSSQGHTLRRKIRGYTKFPDAKTFC